MWRKGAKEKRYLFKRRGWPCGERGAEGRSRRKLPDRGLLAKGQSPEQALPGEPPPGTLGPSQSHLCCERGSSPAGNGWEGRNRHEWEDSRLAEDGPGLERHLLRGTGWEGGWWPSLCRALHPAD